MFSKKIFSQKKVENRSSDVSTYGHREGGREGVRERERKRLNRRKQNTFLDLGNFKMVFT